MDDEFVKQLLDKLENDLNISSCNDFIGNLFDQRAEKIHTSISKNKEYKEQLKVLHKLNDEIIAKYENGREIISLIEDFKDNYIDTTSLIEKQMYKYGLYDGMKLIIEGLKNN